LSGKKNDILKNVHAVIFDAVKVDGDMHLKVCLCVRNILKYQYKLKLLFASRGQHSFMFRQDKCDTLVNFS